MTDNAKSTKSKSPSLRAIEGGSDTPSPASASSVPFPRPSDDLSSSPSVVSGTTDDDSDPRTPSIQRPKESPEPDSAPKPALTRPAYGQKRPPPAALAGHHSPPPPAAPGAQTTSARPEVMPVAGPAQIERRHWGIMASFIAVVVLPIIVSSAYLWLVARDQHASTVAFSIRKEEFQSSLDILGGLSKLSGGGSSDTDILYEFILSQELVASIDKKLDLSNIYSTAWPMDPVFAYDPSGTIEDLVRHWKRKVQIIYDTGSGLITLRVLAFDPDDATNIANEILAESTAMINDLSSDARRDATRYAREELALAVERLKQARGELTTFRLRNQIVDPQADLQGQMGVLNNLQVQLTESMVELDLLKVSARDDDPRIQKAARRIEVIENRIADERKKFGIGGKGPGGEDYATLVAEFERLTVDREFAEQAYRAALVGYDSAQAEANRQSRYLAAFIHPTRAERSDFPRRWTLLALTSFFALMAWAIGVLIYYSVRDRR